MARILGPALAADADRARGPVMSISDVGDGDFCERLDESLASLHPPNGVADAVRSGEVVNRCLGIQNGLGDAVDLRMVPVRQENGSRVGAEGVDETGAVVLFVFARLFVLLDDVLLVVLDMADTGEACLHVGSHLLLVKVHAGACFPHERSRRFQPQQLSFGGCVDDVRVGVGVLGKIDFRPVHMEQGVRIAACEGRGLLSIDDVVGDAGYLVGQGGSGH